MSGSKLLRWSASAVSTILIAALVAVLAPAPASALQNLPFVVNSTSDAADASLNGVCLTSGNVCTLRAALQEANFTAGHDVIDFAILGPAPHLIEPATELPWLDDLAGVTIDGYSQSGSSVNTSPMASNAVIAIELKGQGFGYPKPNGLRFNSPGNTVTGLSIWNFNINLYLHGTYDNAARQVYENHITGNFIGTDPTGTAGASTLIPGSPGILLEDGASRNYVGGPSNAERNVISGNAFHGVATYNNDTQANVVKNNIIGLSPDGSRALPNRSHGIDLNTGTIDTVIGGTGPGEPNIISGNSQNGIEISHNPGTLRNSVVGNLIGTSIDGKSTPLSARNGEYGMNLEGAGSCSTNCPPDAGQSTVTDNVIVNSGLGGVLIDKGQHGDVLSNNHIGVLADGTTPAPNRLYGVRMEKGAFSNRIGPGNVIAFNGEAANQGAGVQIVPTGSDPYDPNPVATYDNTITANSIHDNAGLGIDLAPLGSPTPMPDSLVNGGINMPVLTSATSSDISVTTCAGCTVELFYADGTKDEYGEGKTYIASSTADQNGKAHFVVGSAAGGKVVTATTTDTVGNTSEFSHNALVSSK